MTERDIKYAAFAEDDIKNNRGRIVDSCAEIRYLLEHPETGALLARHYLNDILTHATTFSAYYRQFRGVRMLTDLPIVNKDILKAHWDEIAVKDLAELPDSRVKFTSGSTGTPFKMVMDRYKHSRWIAGIKTFREMVGVRSHDKALFVSSATLADKNIPLERQERDNVYYRECPYFDDQSMNDLLMYLQNGRFCTMTSMASVLGALAKFVESGKAAKWDGESFTVFSSSEPLKEHTRKVLSEYFGGKVYNIFANEENGVMAAEDGSGLGCRVNTADFFFEVLSMDSDAPAKDGEAGRLVITDYFNKAFPLLRYENGDLVVKKTMDDGRVYFTEILGRKVDALYTTDGRMVHYFNSISFLEPFMDIKQFQLIQEDLHHFTWVLNTENRSYEEMIVSGSKALFGEDSEWRFEYVDEIPKLQSGKTRMTVCKIDTSSLK